jgi:ribosomal protein S18 acetylase RimI-like enzyme
MLMYSSSEEFLSTMSLYANYVKERSGKEIVESEQGFATYSFTEDKGVYIEDIYVLPDFRQLGAASALADEVVARALKEGCDKLYGTVCPTAKNSTASLKVLLGYGMRLHSSKDNLVVFIKDLG